MLNWLFGSDRTIDPRTVEQQNLAQMLGDLLRTGSGGFTSGMESINDAIGQAQAAQELRDEQIRRYLKTIGRYEAGGEALVRALSERLAARAASAGRASMRTARAQNPSLRGSIDAGMGLAAENAGARAQNDYLSEQLTAGQRMDLLSKAQAQASDAATRMGQSLAAPYGQMALNSFGMLGGMVNAQPGLQQVRDPGLLDVAAPLISAYGAIGGGQRSGRRAREESQPGYQMSPLGGMSIRF